MYDLRDVCALLDAQKRTMKNMADSISWQNKSITEQTLAIQEQTIALNRIADILAQMIGNNTNTSESDELCSQFK
ncbi:MAG: hypothetical protein J6D03_10225 [Clostridia bacterium]|nr:hypothetical protein [Clostridia bacterium]HBC84417.1 hypothetical protein [Clostridiales bacterium]